MHESPLLRLLLVFVGALLLALGAESSNATANVGDRIDQAAVVGSMMGLLNGAFVLCLERRACDSYNFGFIY